MLPQGSSFLATLGWMIFIPLGCKAGPTGSEGDPRMISFRRDASSGNPKGIAIIQSGVDGPSRAGEERLRRVMGG